MKFNRLEKKIFKMALCGLVVGVAAVAYSIARGIG